MSAAVGPKIPFPIYKPTAGIERYVLYDIDVITWLRREHNILGVLVGTLPQIPSQNVFLGLPLQLQTEEARLLVTKGLASVVDDPSCHQRDYGDRSPTVVAELKESLLRERKEIARSMRDAKNARSEVALRKDARRKKAQSDQKVKENEPDLGSNDQAEATIFDPAIIESQGSIVDSGVDQEAWSITPSSCTTTLSRREATADPSLVPMVDHNSYALYEHLHRQGYFMTPGLRFGCQFSVYPGDPLRYHSHFLAVSRNWNEEMDLLHLIGGGRLGTGVKKGWMVGGIESSEEPDKDRSGSQDPMGMVRTFCIEWGGM